MPKQRKNELIMGRFFNWKLFQRKDVYWADGRTNPKSGGRHSLATKVYQEALDNLRHLDAVKAIEVGLADESILDQGGVEQLSLDHGVDLYRAHVQRPLVTGGASPGTWKRYRAVFDKVLPYWKQRGMQSWNQVRKANLESYAAWLDGEGYAYRTEFLELTTIKQCINWFIEEGHVPADCRIRLPLAKPTGTDTYCWRPEEVKAILDHCRATTELQWLADVLTSLACTGMRISELASLRWSDVNSDQNLITLKDETANRRRRKNGPIRQTKSRRSRSFPIHEDLREVLDRIDRTADGKIFHGPKGGVLSPDITRRTLIRDVLDPLAANFASQHDEIGFKDGRLHSFRHYFCSTCANNNTPEQLVMEWMGHQESKMVRHYYHAHDAEAQKQMKRLNFTGDAAAE
jgi:integrase